MGNLNEFRLSYETAFLFVLSYEYDIPFPQLLSMYNISEKIFWAYISLFSNMSKMGVRKGSQLSKMANRIYKNIRNIKNKNYIRLEVDVVDEDGNLVCDDKGEVLKEKQVKIELVPIILTEEEQHIKDVMTYYITTGYSDGETFYTDEQIMDKRLGITRRGNSISIDGVLFTDCTLIEHMIEKYFPNMTVSDYRALSVKEIGNLFKKVTLVEDATNEARV